MCGFFWTVTTLVYFSILHHADDVAGQLTAAPPTCPGNTFTFRCTVTGDMSGITIWRVNGSSECTLVHRSTSSSICGPRDVFTARSGTGFGTTATSFTSTLSGTASPMLNSTLVECFGPANNVQPGNRVGSSALQILGPPSIPTLSCVDLSEDVSGAVNVTVSWTLSGGDSADFYLINITTNAPQTPYGGLLNITSASVTQYELTGFMAGYEYNITVRGVNCGSLVGIESEPLTFRPQVPDAPADCHCTLVYSQSSWMLLFINSTWDTVPDPVDPCPGETGNITKYQISFGTKHTVDTQNVNTARCTNGRCSNTFVPPSSLPYYSVSASAENVVGVGAARTCTTQDINAFNVVLTGEMVDVSSPRDAKLNCIFLRVFRGSARCIVQYGTDPTYMNLPYSAESTETGTAGDTVSVILREQLNSSTVYYYTVSAVSGDITVSVRGNFTTPLYISDNDFLTGEVVDLSSPSDVVLNCTFLYEFIGSARCRVQYGTDPTYMNLPYSAESSEFGTAGDTVSVVLRERLNSSTVYYYTVSAVSGVVTVVMRGNFSTPLYTSPTILSGRTPPYNTFGGTVFGGTVFGGTGCGGGCILSVIFGALLATSLTLLCV